jgi:hypothetical protein
MRTLIAAILIDMSVACAVNAALSGGQIFRKSVVTPNAAWFLAEKKSDHVWTAYPLGADWLKRNSDVSKELNILESPQLSEVTPSLGESFCLLLVSSGPDEGSQRWANNWLLLPRDVVNARLAEFPKDNTGLQIEWLQNLLVGDLNYLLTRDSVDLTPATREFLVTQAIESLLFMRVSRSEVLAELNKATAKNADQLSSLFVKYRISFGDRAEIVTVANEIIKGERGPVETESLLQFLQIGLQSNSDIGLSASEIEILWKSNLQPIQVGLFGQIDGSNLPELREVLRSGLKHPDLSVSYAALKACRRIFGRNSVRQPAFEAFSKNSTGYLKSALEVIDRPALSP